MEFWMKNGGVVNSNLGQTGGLPGIRPFRGMELGGLAGWLLQWWRTTPVARPRRLALIERITLGPKQALALVEAEGMHLLVTISPDGAPTFYPLDSTRIGRESEPHRTLSKDRSVRPDFPRVGRASNGQAVRSGRVSW